MISDTIIKTEQHLIYIISELNYFDLRIFIDEAADKMKYVYDHYSEAKVLADLCRKRIVKDFDWSVSARKVYNRLLEIN